MGAQMDLSYTGDSFFTLTMGERVGLILVTLLLSAAMLAVGRWLRGVIWAVALIWAFIWLSPQAYYLYYQWIFEGLPWQIVVKTPPSPLDLLRFLTFQAGDTLSAHGQGLLGWLLIGSALWRRHISRRRATR